MPGAEPWPPNEVVVEAMGAVPSLCGSIVSGPIEPEALLFVTTFCRCSYRAIGRPRYIAPSWGTGGSVAFHRGDGVMTAYDNSRRPG